MHKYIKNSKGVTLFELLVVFALLSMVLLLISGVHLSGQKQYASQTKQINDQANVRLVVKLLTKDIRSTSGVIEFPSESSIRIPQGGNMDEYAYSASEQAILKNGVPIAENIERFYVAKSASGNRVEIEIKSIPTETGNTASISTVIYMRE